MTRSSGERVGSTGFGNFAMIPIPLVPNELGAGDGVRTHILASVRGRAAMQLESEGRLQARSELTESCRRIVV